MKRKINFLIALLLIGGFSLEVKCASARESSSVSRAKPRSIRRLLDDITRAENTKDNAKDEDFIWESKPIEIYAARIQILDKISGKVFRWEAKTNESMALKGVELTLRRCFKNSPEDPKEVYAFIEIIENNKKIFAGWLFASSPSINLFAHPVYDVRVEF
jgi:hypothetical protein